MSKGEYCSGFGKQVGQFITEKSGITVDPLEAYSVWEERESVSSQLFQKDFGWRNASFVERRVRADWESVKKRVD